MHELKYHLPAYLDRVKAGEEITVTRYGRPIARLAAVSAELDRMTALVAEGVVRPPSTDRRRLPSKPVTVAPGEPLADLVAGQRR